MHALNPLQEHSRNVTSQFGEDGLLEEIFRRIGSGSKTCVEFGAWDGRHLSNTWKLWNEEGWAAILIEGDAKRCVDLQESLAGNSRVKAVQAFVQPDGENSLDAILSRSGAPREIDLLSIDVDGDEYWIWDGLAEHEARVVVVEFNPTIPPEIDVVQTRGSYFGASALALVRLGHQKGFKLAACTQTNCVFVRNADFGAMNMDECQLGAVFPRNYLTYVVNSYDGKTFVTQNPIYSPALPVYSARLLQELFLKERFHAGPMPAAPVTAPDGLLPVAILATPGRQAPDPLPLRIARKLLRDTCRVTGITAFQDRVARTRERNRRIQEWREKGCPSPPPHEIKQEVLKTSGRSARARVLVETGTYMGDMVEAMRPHFRRIFSIELSEDFHAKATQRFSGCPGITILQGDSARVLPKILAELQEPAVFWLDGHYSAGNTAKGEFETPIMAELDHIFSHAVKGHVILIDDARCFDGTNDYPTIDALKAHVLSRRPGANIAVKDDIIRII